MEGCRAEGLAGSLVPVVDGDVLTVVRVVHEVEVSEVVDDACDLLTLGLLSELLHSLQAFKAISIRALGINQLLYLERRLLC